MRQTCINARDLQVAGATPARGLSLKMVKALSYVVQALSGFALASNLYAADPAQVKFIRDYVFRHGTHVSIDGSKFHSLELTAEQINYQDYPNAIILLTTNFRYTEKPFLRIFLDDDKNSFLFVDGRLDSNRLTNLDGLLDKVAVEDEGEINLKDNNSRKKFQDIYDKMIRAVNKYITK